MENEKYAPHVKDIARVLKNKKTEKEIGAELRRYVEEMMVPLPEAKRSIVAKNGGDASLLGSGIVRTLAEITPNQSSIDFLCRVVSTNPKEVTVEGKQKNIHYGIVGDNTKTLPFTAWGEFEYTRGDVLRVTNAYSKDWQGSPQLNFGDRTTVALAEKDALAPYVPQNNAANGGQRSASTPYKIKDIKGGTSNISATGRITAIEKKEVTVKGAPKTVFSGTLADETGRIAFSCWSDMSLRLGEVIKVNGAYAKSWRGIPQLSFDERSAVERLDQSALPSLEDMARNVRAITIEELAEAGGASGITVRGVIVDVKSGSGLVFRCPQCERVLQKGACAIHGSQDGRPDLRIKAVIDDGSGALSAVFGKDVTEKILGKTLDECLALAKEKMNTEVIQDMLRDILLASPIEASGNVTSDDFGLMLIGRGVGVIKSDIRKEAQKLSEELSDSKGVE